MVVHLEVSDSSGSLLGERDISVQEPVMGYAGTPTPAGGLESVVFQAIDAMRVGGTRRSAHRVASYDCLNQANGMFVLADWLTVAVGQETILTTGLRSRCTPRYCRLTYYTSRRRGWSGSANSPANRETPCLE